ncbi:MAG: hypothetical protein IKC03_11380, partial [Oscillospiraceae bacterium]|nr:hypothetical protein [Oscillospiraceae bacterium]
MKNTQTNKKNTNRFLCAAVVVLLAILAILFFLRGCSNSSSAPTYDDTTSSSNPGIIYDHGAVEGGWDAADTESIIANLNEKVEEGMINISMNTSPNFANGTSAGNLMIVN